MEEAIGDQALAVNLVFGTLVFAAAAKAYVLPRLSVWRPEIARARRRGAATLAAAASKRLREELSYIPSQPRRRDVGNRSYNCEVFEA